MAKHGKGSVARSVPHLRIRADGTPGVRTAAEIAILSAGSGGKPIQRSVRISERPVNITFERDSVCAGDDVLAPNSRVVALAATPRLTDVLSETGPVLAYLPCVQASKTYWRAWIGGECVASLSFTCESTRTLTARLLVPDRTVEASRVYFSEDGQERAG